MKKMLVLTSAVAFALASITAVADNWVNGYTRSDGTYVQGHYRSSPNSTVTDNFSFEGNRNPYTGEIGSNRYESNPSSPYYDGSSASSSGWGSTRGNTYGNSGATGYGSDYDSGYDSGW